MGKINCGRVILGGLGGIPMGIFPVNLLLVSSLSTLVSYAAGGLVAGWLYREGDASS